MPPDTSASASAAASRLRAISASTVERRTKVATLLVSSSAKKSTTRSTTPPRARSRGAQRHSGFTASRRLAGSRGSQVLAGLPADLLDQSGRRGVRRERGAVDAIAHRLLGECPSSLAPSLACRASPRGRAGARRTSRGVDGPSARRAVSLLPGLGHREPDLDARGQLARFDQARRVPAALRLAAGCRGRRRPKAAMPSASSAFALAARERGTRGRGPRGSRGVSERQSSSPPVLAAAQHVAHDREIRLGQRGALRVMVARHELHAVGAELEPPRFGEEDPGVGERIERVRLLQEDRRPRNRGPCGRAATRRGACRASARRAIARAREIEVEVERDARSRSRSAARRRAPRSA